VFHSLRKKFVYLTARPYLLAGFTAASIVASVSLAPSSTVHLPSAHAADVRLAAAESELVSEVRELREVQTRALASVFERTTTAVVPRLARSSSAASSVAPSSAVTGIAPSSVTTGIAQHNATAVAAQGSVTLLDLDVLFEDANALSNDLTGAPAVVLIQSAIATQLAINDVITGALQKVPGDVVNSLELGIGGRINAIGADLGTIAAELNHIIHLALGTTSQSGQGTTTSNLTTSHVQDSAASAVSKLAVPLKSGAAIPRPSISKSAPSTPTVKPAGHGYTAAGAHPAKQSSAQANGAAKHSASATSGPKHAASGTSRPKHSAPGGQHTDGPKHRKH
jgi:hypothetical protein